MTNEFYTNVRVWGDNILYIGYKDGVRVQEKLDFSPTLYVACPQGHTPDSYSYEGLPLKAIHQGSIKDAKEFVRNYANVPNFQIYGQDKANYQFIGTTFKDDVDYRMNDIRTFFYDIEVYSGNGFPDPHEAKEEITCISLKDRKTKEMHVWVVNGKWGGDFDPNNLQYIDKSDLTFKLVPHIFTNETDMLWDFICWFENNYPDILSGWYSRHFDIPYTINRIKRIFGNKIASKLSPWGTIQTKTTNIKRFNKTEEQTVYDIYGIAELDYQDLYKKYTYTTSESYSLGYITKKHLKKGKLEYSGTLDQLLKTNYQQYVEYNIMDAERIDQLDLKLQFINLIVEVAYAGKVAAYTDALGTVKFWEILIYNHLLSKNQQTEIKEISGFDKSDKYAGAYVKDPLVGKHKWVVSFDLESLYPSLIRQVNIGPETKIDYFNQDLADLIREVTPEKLVNKSIDLSLLKKYDVSLSGNAQVYSRDEKSFLSELMEKFFNKRKEYRKLMAQAIEIGDKDKKQLYHTKQLAMKILINSAYGGIGNSYFQYFSIDNAEAVTVTGQVVIQWIEKRLNAYLNSILSDLPPKDRIAAIDTDSVYIILDDLVSKVMPNETDVQKVVEFLDKVSQAKFVPFINKSYEELFDYLNSKENLMNMKREIISDVAIWTGKKRYFMNVYDKEGERFEEPELKVMGLEVVKSSTPAICREALEDCLKIMLRKNESDLLDYITEFKKKFKASEAHAIASPRTCNDLSKFVDANGYPVKGCPIHVRGAIMHNFILRQRGLDKKFDPIKDGNKVKYIYMKMPNPIHENVFAFEEKLQKELELDQYIDYDEQFEKAFLSPLRIVATTIGWTTERTNDLTALFG